MSYGMRSGVVWAFFLTAAAACSRGGPQTAPLEAVQAVPSPSVQAWIRSISPTQPAGTTAQIRVVFAGPVVPLTAIGSDAETSVTSRFHLTPEVPWHFRVLTPKMIAFEPQSALPAATRFRVTVDAGTRDLSGNTLQKPLTWTFVTTALTLQTPQPDTTTVLQPKFRLRSNAPVDVASLAANASFSGGGETVGGQVSTPSPQPSASPDPLAYDVQPERTLKMGTRYELRVTAGVRPASGNLSSDKDVRVPFSTYGEFAAVRIKMTRSEGDAPRFAAGDPQIVFSNAVDANTVDGNISIEPKVASNVKLFSVGDDTRTVAINPYVLTPGTRYTITPGSGLRDIYGQAPTARAQTFTAGDLSAAISAPGNNAIFISSAPLALQYTATNLPQNRYRAAYRVVQPEQLVYASDAQPQDANALLPSEASWNSATLANAIRNREQTVAIPLSKYLH